VRQGFTFLPHGSGQAIAELFEKFLLPGNRLMPTITVDSK
jgi:hypothetical protein